MTIADARNGSPPTHPTSDESAAKHAIPAPLHDHATNGPLYLERSSVLVHAVAARLAAPYGIPRDDIYG